MRTTLSVNASTGETVEREMTAKEESDFNADSKAYLESKMADLAEKEKAKESALGKLAKLGLSLDDLSALGL